MNKAQAGRKGGCRRSLRKTRAAKLRFRRVALGAFINWLAANPKALDHPDLQAPLDSLTELLVVRKVVQLGLADGIAS